VRGEGGRVITPTLKTIVANPYTCVWAPGLNRKIVPYPNHLEVNDPGHPGYPIGIFPDASGNPKVYKRPQAPEQSNKGSF